MIQIRQWIYRDFEEVSSTNDAVKTLFETHQKRCIVSSKRQTSGRGRLGRKWESLEGNLFVSFAYQIEQKKVGQYAILSALAAFETIRFFAPALELQIKWPNDILLMGKKICGILFEKGEGDYFVMGVGINVVAAPKVESPFYQATSLADFNVQADRKAVLEKLVSSFDALEALYQQQGFNILKQYWLDNAYGHGKKVCIKNHQSEISGVLKGLDETGALILQTPEGTHKIFAGDLYGVNDENA
ncbi:MAG: biotin--[Alphaproteobacteria bacterium]|nr:biotin--[acetyl-CoA-carboxylase] ligase [Alphaproteobacteria bacterium]